MAGLMATWNKAFGLALDLAVTPCLLLCYNNLLCFRAVRRVLSACEDTDAEDD